MIVDFWRKYKLRQLVENEFRSLQSSFIIWEEKHKSKSSLMLDLDFYNLFSTTFYNLFNIVCFIMRILGTYWRIHFEEHAWNILHGCFIWFFIFLTLTWNFLKCTVYKKRLTTILCKKTLMFSIFHSEVTCPIPMRTQARSVVFSDPDVVVGTTATFSCKIGYEIKGENGLTCGKYGSWSKPMPICTGKKWKKCCYHP